MCPSFSPAAFEELVTGLKNNKSLEIIDFSYNDISDDCGAVLARMIQEQSEMRDYFIWMQSLREINMTPGGSKMGLKEFYLHHNKLGRNFVKAMSKVIKFDNYMRVIDMSYNKIDEKTI
jgi:Ran GTPase-activating protein (RanGAP) involved in mRNA processing and transport